MKIAIGLYVLVSLFANHSRAYVSVECCNPDLRLKVYLKGVKIEKSPEYHIREGGLKVPVHCALFIRKKSKVVTLTTIENNSYPQYKLIDSFTLSSNVPNIQKRTFYNIKIMDLNFIQYDILYQNEVINMIFEKEELDFALQLIDNLEITRKI